MATTGLYYDALFLQHETGLHPETPNRLVWITEHLKKTGLWDRCFHPACRDATLDELCLVHDRDYVLHVKSLAESGGGLLDSETIVSKMSYAAAARAAGTGLAAVEGVLRGEMRNALCLVRPPGHHAMPDQGMGFCIFNNVAIAARYLRERLKVGRVAIFDWDAHHGNGTHYVFYGDGTVFYASLHLWPYWPFSGSPEETGEGPGLGATVNRPILHGTPPEEYMAAARGVIRGPMADFKPEFILISAGFDPYREDPLAPMGLEPEHFRSLTDEVAKLSEGTCGGRLVSLLEGGYHPDGLPRCVAAHLTGLLETPQAQE